MPDLATIATALSSIKTATEIARLIKDGDKSLAQAEYKLKVAELVSALADAKIEIAGIQDIILDKDREISNLKKMMDLKHKMIWEQPYYWKDIPENNGRDGPFCQQCFDNESKLIRLQGGDGVWTCNTCKTTVTDSTYHEHD